MKIAITGASGQLGTDLARVLWPSCEVVPLTRGDMDVTDPNRVMETIAAIRPGVIIHTAAYTNVDRAETEFDAAYAINALGTRNVALGARMCGAKLVYISTDYVFDGTKNCPYTESDHPMPLSVYGQTKLSGEQFVQLLCEQYYIVRTAWLFGDTGRNFVRMIAELSARQSRIMAADDAVGSPTYSLDLAMFIGHLIRTDKYGLYHATNSGICSRYEFVQAIIEEVGACDVQVVAVPSSVFQLPAPRPAFSALDHAAIRKQSLPAFRSWRSALHDYVETSGLKRRKGGGEHD